MSPPSDTALSDQVETTDVAGPSGDSSKTKRGPRQRAGRKVLKPPKAPPASKDPKTGSGKPASEPQDDKGSGSGDAKAREPFKGRSRGGRGGTRQATSEESSATARTDASYGSEMDRMVANSTISLVQHAEQAWISLHHEDYQAIVNMFYGEIVARIPAAGSLFTAQEFEHMYLGLLARHVGAMQLSAGAAQYDPSRIMDVPPTLQGVSGIVNLYAQIGVPLDKLHQVEYVPRLDLRSAPSKSQNPPWNPVESWDLCMADVPELSLASPIVQAQVAAITVEADYRTATSQAYGTAHGYVRLFIKYRDKIGYNSATFAYRSEAPTNQTRFRCVHSSATLREVIALLQISWANIRPQNAADWPDQPPEQPNLQHELALHAYLREHFATDEPALQKYLGSLTTLRLKLIRHLKAEKERCADVAVLNEGMRCMKGVGTDSTYIIPTSYVFWDRANNFRRAIENSVQFASVFVAPDAGNMAIYYPVADEDDGRSVRVPGRTGFNPGQANLALLLRFVHTGDTGLPLPTYLHTVTNRSWRTMRHDLVLALISGSPDVVINARN